MTLMVFSPSRLFLTRSEVGVEVVGEFSEGSVIFVSFYNDINNKLYNNDLCDFY